ncbi:transporter substrate-binding domain-containing protein [Radiobacillus kanasensis]|uniref:transporter substrate-binding domain-containing protein n=1 Tax=Radiobacillus kanasensis TaxID=2844358 RepID=UPI001E49B4AB|nr:transporter substrate-binding domain-containing protein [Radiobacillus kanasensis]UFT97955.1 transporter substrate-binding domain-containing protein [Radiobacillus kanasensis]
MVAGLLGLAACGSSDSSQESEQGETNDSKYNLVTEGTFTFAASGEFKPFSWVKTSGEMTGYDIDVGNAIAKELGLETAQEKYKFSAIVEGVKTGKFDAAVASHTITDKRKESVDFSIPYYYSGAQIFTRPESDVEKLEDLNGKEIGVSKGSTYAKYAEEVTENVKVYSSDVVALQALAKGKHDAVITDFLTGKEAIGTGGLEIKGKSMIDRSEQAVAVSKDNPELLKAVNEALETLRNNGTLTEISKKYFGEDISVRPE